MIWSYSGLDKDGKPVRGVIDGPWTDFTSDPSVFLHLAGLCWLERGVHVQSARPVSNQRGLSDEVLANWYADRCLRAAGACAVSRGEDPRRSAEQILFDLIEGRNGDVRDVSEIDDALIADVLLSQAEGGRILRRIGPHCFILGVSQLDHVVRLEFAGCDSP